MGFLDGSLVADFSLDRSEEHLPLTLLNDRDTPEVLSKYAVLILPNAVALSE